MKRVLIPLSVLLAHAVVASDGAASPFRWEPLYEPGCGGAIVSVAVSPHDPRHVVSGGDMLGTAASFDGGESWTPGLGLPSYEMATPTFHPTRPDELWIGSCMGPFVSRDGGRTWQGKRAGMPAPCSWKYTAMIERVLVDPSNPARLLAFGGTSRRWGRCETMGAVWLSENGGDDWRRLGTVTADGFTTNAVTGANIVKAWWGAEKKAPWAHLFADGVGWFSSLDGGRTWRRRKVGGLPGPLADVATHPADPNVVWAVVAAGEPAADGNRTPGGIWRSDDRGRTFRPSDAGIEKIVDAHPKIVTHFGALEVSPVAPYRLYVSDLGWRAASVWTSADGGATWRRACARWTLTTACFAGPSCRIAASPTEADVAYAYNSEYIVKTTDGGATWTDMTAYRPDPVGHPDSWRGRGWNGWCSRTVVFNPYRKGQAIVQAMDAARAWISDDGLQTWRYARGDVAPWNGGDGAAFAKDGTIYVTSGQRGANCGVLVSRDGGATWRARHGAAAGLPEFGEGVYGDVWVDPDDGARAFVVFGDALYRTADGGETWRRDAAAGMAGVFAVDPTRPTRFYVRNGQGVFATEDWQSFVPLGFAADGEGGLACDARGRVLVCCGRVGDRAQRGLWRYDPPTRQWTRLTDEPLACAVAADPRDPTRLVLTTMDNPYHDFAGGHGVFVSSDDGATWTPANDGLHVRRLTCVAFDPFDAERIVAGTCGGGFVTARWPKANRLRPADGGFWYNARSQNLGPHTYDRNTSPERHGNVMGTGPRWLSTNLHEFARISYRFVNIRVNSWTERTAWGQDP